MKSLLQQIGVTTDGRPVYAGVFKMYDTVGLPLDTVFDEILNRRAAIAWPTFYEDAKRGGWKREKILKAIDYALRDCGRVDLAEVVVRRLGVLHPPER